MKKIFFIGCILLFVCFSQLINAADQQRDQTQLRQRIQSTIITQVNEAAQKLLLIAPTIVPEKLEVPSSLLLTRFGICPQPIIQPQHIEMKGLLKPVITNDKKIGAELFDNEGALIARLTSRFIDFTEYNRLLVHVIGCKTYYVSPTLTSPDVDTTAVPTIEVRKIYIIAPWIEKKGTVVGLIAMQQGTSTSKTTSNQTYIAGSETTSSQTYMQGLADDNGTWIATLFSSTVPLYKYTGKMVQVGGYQRGYPTLADNDSTGTTIIQTIDVRKITILPVLVTKKGLIKASKQLMYQNTSNFSSLIPTIYSATLLDNDGTVIAHLRSRNINFTKYDGLYVEVEGYQYPGTIPVITDTEVDNDSALSLLPVINVTKITILYTPPPIETWRGIIKPRVDDSTIAPNAPFILVTPGGTFVGYLTAETNEMMAKLQEFSTHYLVALTGPVYTLSDSTSNVEIKMMSVEKIVVLQDLRHIIKMTDEPLVFQVGQTVAFNKIADIIKPVVLPLDNDSSDSGLCCRFLYQKAWDFDTCVYYLPLDNEGMELDNDPPRIPITYVQYDYTHDSRLKCMDEPTFEFKKPGIYRITITCEVINENGFTIREESASRIIQVFPELTITNENQATWQEILDLSAEIQKEETVSELMKEAHDTAMAIIRNLK